MNLGRASMLKMLPFIFVGTFVGIALSFVSRGSSLHAIVSWGGLLIVVAFAVYVVWLLGFKNQATRKASSAQRQDALQFAPVADKGVLYVFRKQYVGMLVGRDLLLDQRLIGQTRGYCFYRLEVAPGTHELAGSKKCAGPMQVNVAAGEIVYIEQEMQMGMVSSGYQYRLVDNAAQAQAKIRGCKLLLPA
ncbi:hypothetical protein [Montanilutibacter psychrotolerans]|uniref:DUF2846 domain-containing protein n=1 Tax=Montanilutibacter psychrotolerans TaxID=1327343 RepID=A0A3M8SXS3_9GAMM|nr:hypothetical protein [Lysobacter psychrotolerans]RNF86099.1 hypothetical protein EER27_01295 [Lysobacter psychrotolerans]